MVDDDIYGNKRKYLRFVSQYKSSLQIQSRRKDGYRCKNKANIKYITKLLEHFDLQDISFSRRLRLLGTFKLIIHSTIRELKVLNDADDREEINKIIRFARTRYSDKTMKDFIIDIRFIWRLLFPEKDSKGRIDDSIVPYVVRHLKMKIDPSRMKRRKDLLTFDEYKKILQSFSQDLRAQAFLSMTYESLGRPQEVLFLRIKDIELFDNYAKAYISEHGKEGVGILRIIESYPYLLRWFNIHPLKNKPDAFLFLNTGKTNQFEQWKPPTINKMLKIKCKEIGIAKPITCYSFKRNGVTHRRLRGDDDKQIQETARWTSTKQLHTYDLAGQEETFKVELIRRGIIPKSKEYEYLDTDFQQLRICPFCNHQNPFTDTVCEKCSRLLDRDAIILKEKQKDEEIAIIKKRLEFQENYMRSLFKKRKVSDFSDDELKHLIQTERRRGKA